MAGAAIAGRGPWYHGWNVVGACVLSQVAANAMPINAFSLFLHDWARDFGAPVSTLQLGIVACGLGCALVAPITGLLVDRFSPRAMLALGLGGTALFCLALSAVTRVWPYVALYAVVMPFALSLATAIPANAVIARWFVRKRGLALGISAFGLGMGGVVMPPLVAAVLPLFGWRMIWRAAGLLIGLVALPLVWAVVRDRPAPRDGRRYLAAEGAGAAPGHGQEEVRSAIGFAAIARRRTFWLLLIAYLPMLAVYGGLAQNIAPIATSRGASPQTASLMMSLLYASQVVLTLLGGALSDRAGNRLPLAGLAFAGALGAAAVALTANIGVLALGALLAGAAGAFWPLLAAAIAAEFGAAGFGRAFGALIFFLPLTVAAPFAVAKAQEGTGSYTPIFLVLALLSGIGGLAALMIREGGGPRRPHRRAGAEAVALG